MLVTATQMLLDKHKISRPPIPMRVLVKQYAKLYYFDETLDPDFADESGFTIYQDMSYSIYINRGVAEGRDNFTLAHELAHIVLHHLEYFDPNVASNSIIQLLDKEADIFASNLLMPADWITNACKFCPPQNASNIAKLKNMFGVSWQALIIRLHILNLQPYYKSIKTLRRCY